ncbi:hypothetical protein [Bacillus sp. V59.32b]|uniref:hypothetical protein n=1 Tax=Bacillus sp. V59.32b TaxID=1758642 RepID=UPI000E3D36BE|nr:hypothetical protein [Bacillus sp. V59.32b]RFU60291.1 hypothetical protein D0463_17510 [Bacillus sp. V59.32b]
MEKLILITCVSILGLSILACSHQEDNEAAEFKQTKRKFIMMDSVNEPLPPEVKNIDSMLNKPEPQQIPNANINDLIVITKMTAL